MYLYLFIFNFCSARMEARALPMLGKSSIPGPQKIKVFKYLVHILIQYTGKHNLGTP
jgi:hypothetical protein